MWWAVVCRYVCAARDALLRTVDGAEVGVLEEPHEVGLRRLLQREDGGGLEAEVRLEVLRDLAVARGGVWWCLISRRCGLVRSTHRQTHKRDDLPAQPPHHKT